MFKDNALNPPKSNVKTTVPELSAQSQAQTSIVAPPPPPFPMSNTRPIQWLPDHLKPKKRFHANVPMKKANWMEIDPRKISKNAFWVKCREDKLASEDILVGLAAKFSQNPKAQKNSMIPRTITKKCVDLRVISQKSAHAISILLAATLKRITYERIKECILQCDTSDTSILNSDIIQQLIKYLPSHDQLKRLQKIKESGEELSEPERFIATISEIDQLVPRLYSIDLKLRFNDVARDVGADIGVGMAAFEELEKSQKFGKILELILLFGNFLNSGSARGPAFGFDISFLTKLNDTKDKNNKQTLLQYIVEIIEKKFPELLSFGKELPHAEDAVKVSFEKINENMKQISTSLDHLNMALEEIKEPQTADDRFHEMMGIIANQYNDEMQALIEKNEIMENQYKRLGEYFSFNPEKYPMESLFQDINNFKAMFQQAHLKSKTP